MTTTTKLYRLDGVPEGALHRVRNEAALLGEHKCVEAELSRVAAGVHDGALERHLPPTGGGVGGWVRLPMGGEVSVFFFGAHARARPSSRTWSTWLKKE